MTHGSLGAMRTHRLTGLADFLRRFGAKRGTGRSVIIAPKDLDFGLSRVFTGHLGEDPRPLHVVHSLEEAVAWLGEGADPHGVGG